MPDGILNCLEYLDANTCRLCKAQHYLFNNQCIKVAEPIDGCLFYSDSLTCLHCDSARILLDNKCYSTTLSCLTYSNQNECESCPSNQALFIENGLRICKDFESIPNCSVHSKLAPIKCEVCNLNYYLNSNECVAVPETNKIEGCISYLDANNCKVCAAGRVLKLDKKKCVLKSFTNPTTSCTQLEERNPFCVYC